jgi:uncharacterized protein (DUF1697 family)
MDQQLTYIAFLRGINVGGNTLIRMEALKAAFAGMGLRRVRTVLASGNVVFETDQAERGALNQEIQAMLKAAFGFDIAVILRTGAEISALIAADPFKEVAVTPNTRLHVTFLADAPASRLPLPYLSPDRGYGIVRIFDREVCSFVELSAEHGTPELMKLIEQVFGRQLTTRTWNTIVRIGSLLE